MGTGALPNEWVVGHSKNNNIGLLLYNKMSDGIVLFANFLLRNTPSISFLISSQERGERRHRQVSSIKLV